MRLHFRHDGTVLYQVAVMAWHSQVVLSWRRSNILDAVCSATALEEAKNHYGLLEIFNTDQGSQFTSLEFTQAFKEAGVAISRGGKNWWMDMITRSLSSDCRAQ